MEVEASVLVPLVNQFGMMQQQMLDQFQNAMGMLVEMFGTLQREQMDQIRQELDQLREVTREFQDVKLELAAYKRERAEAEAAKAAIEAPPPPSMIREAGAPSPKPSTPNATRAAVDSPSSSTRTSPPAVDVARAEGEATKAAFNTSSSAPAGGPGKRPVETTGAGAEKDRDVMLWLNQRIVTLQNERETRWQKILKLLPGAS
jgi:TolA-binding protein